MSEFLAERELTRARHLLAAGQPVEAEAALREALRWNPAFGQARGLLGERELQHGRLEHAFLEFQSLTELQPKNADGWSGLAQVRINAAQPEEAEAALDHVLELAPNQGGARTLRAELRYQLQRYQGAYFDAEQALQVNPKDARAWLVLVRAAAQVKGPVAAIAVAEKGVALAGNDLSLQRELSLLRAGGASSVAGGPRLKEDSSDHAEKWPGALGALMREFVVKVQQKDWNAAEALEASARAKYPATLMGPWLQGVIELSRGHLESAEKNLLAALAVAPRSHRALTNLVAVWWKQKGPLYTGDRLVALNKNDPEFEYPLPIAAHAYLEADQPAEAESTARLAIGALPGLAIPYRDVANFYLGLDRPSDALGVCEEGLVLFPNDVELQLLHARSSFLLGNRERAIGLYEQLVSEHGDNQAAAGALAALLLETRTDAKSRERALELVRGLELDGPLDPEVLGAMGRVYLMVANDSKRAKSYLEVAVRGAPNNASLRFYLARTLMSDSPARAGQELRTALGSGRPFPEEPEARRLLRHLGGNEK
jgi:tetratricopeptide (TPR) repeat protein